MRTINLLFHDIVKNQPLRNKYAVTEGFFLSLIKLIIAHGKFSLYQKDSGITRVRIFIDDGYASTYTTAAPILKAFNIKPYVAITVNKIDQEGYLTTKQIQELHKNGWIICSHCVSHVGLSIYINSVAQKNPRGGIYQDVGIDGQSTLLTQQEVLYQLMESKNSISKIINCSVDNFVYPYGIYNRFILNGIKNMALYKNAYTCDFGVETETTNPFKIPRYIIENEIPYQKLLRDLKELSRNTQNRR